MVFCCRLFDRFLEVVSVVSVFSVFSVVSCLLLTATANVSLFPYLILIYHIWDRLGSRTSPSSKYLVEFTITTNHHFIVNRGINENQRQKALDG